MPIRLIPALKVLFDLFISDSSEKVLSALKMLHIKDQPLALLGKRLLHPKFVDIDIFNQLGGKAENPLMESRLELDIENDEAFNDWIHKLIRVI